MQRRISKEDVSEYSTEEPSDDIDTEQDEEVLYRSGRLEWSSGNTTVHLVNSSTGLELNSLSLSQALAATGSYKMELRTCRRIGKYVYGAQKRRILSEIGGNSKEEDLKATIDKSKQRAVFIYHNITKLILCFRKSRQCRNEAIEGQASFWFCSRSTSKL